MDAGFCRDFLAFCNRFTDEALTRCGRNVASVKESVRDAVAEESRVTAVKQCYDLFLKLNDVFEENSSRRPSEKSDDNVA